MKKRFDGKVLYLLFSVVLPVLSFFLLQDRLAFSANFTLSILIFCLVLWISEIAPLSIVSILGVLLSVIAGINDIKDAFFGFSNPVVFLMIGSFLIAAAINKHGLDRWISFKILSIKIFSASIFSVLIGLSLITFLLSMWLSNTATTAMMLPVAVGVLNMVRDYIKNFREFSALFLLSIAYASSLGGIGTIVGSPTNLVGIGFLSQEGIHLTFLQWSIFTFPIALISLLFLLVYIWFKVRNFITYTDASLIKNVLMSQPAPKFTRQMLISGLGFIFAIVLWITPSILAIIGSEDLSKKFLSHFPEAGVAIFVASLFFLIPVNLKNFETVLNIQDLKNIDWDTVLLFAGGLSLGKLIEKSGLAEFIGKTFSGAFNTENIYLFFFMLIILVIIATEIMSNTAAAITFIPVVIFSLKSLNLDITYPVMAVIIAASFAFILPVSTPPNAIVYGTKMVPVRTMIKTGLILDIVGSVIIFIFLILFRGGIWQ